MKNQLQMYSLDTRDFYTKEENEIHNKLSWAKGEKWVIEEYILFNVIVDKDLLSVKDIKFLNKYMFEDYCCFKIQKNEDKHLRDFITKLLKDNKSLKKSDEYKDAIINFPLHKEYSDDINMLDKLLTQKLKNSDNNLVRKLNHSSLRKYNKISIFESSFTRTLDLKINEITKDIFIVRVKDEKFYPVMEQLIINSFVLWNSDECKYEKYIVLASTAGQIRLRKVIFIKESVYKQHIKSLMCGLTIKDINNNSEEHGCNVNKWLAYLGLIFTDSDKWEGFDIDKAIVIDDFKTEVKGWVDFIDKDFNVTPKEMGVPNVPGVPICHSDGCGMILPSESKKNFQFRAPWMKGLLTPVNYILYCKKFNNKNYNVTDIYGKVWDLKKDDIRYVFCKSQFKMWKYYSNTVNEDGTVKYGWDIYKENYKEHGCHASKCHEETGNFKNGRFNYQMMQTLTDISDEELDELIKPTKDLITNAYTNKDAMLEVLGAGKYNHNKNYLQQALQIYPELINDKYVKDKLMSSISAKRNDAKFARIKINAKSTFILPDVYAWLQYTFSADKTIAPKGLLADGEVYCRLYKKSPKLLCNRSPHLYKEHAVRKNLANKFNYEWFCTDGLYTSSHDLISKLLQFDVDGDSSLVIGDENIVTIAERNMKDVLPLYYEMGKAEPEIITNKSIYESIKTAWKYGNIGTYSNTLTKFWDNFDEDSDLDIAKVLCSLNNHSIDAAKTKYMPPRPKAIKEKISGIKKFDMPYFAQFAKDELVGKVCDRNESTVNRLCAKVEGIKIPVKDGTKNEKYDFSGVGKLKVAKLMHNPKIVVIDAVIKKYDQLNDLKSSYFRDANSAGLEKEEVASSIYAQIKAELLAEFPELNIVDITDMLVKHEFKLKHKKSFLFNCFGDIIVANLKSNIKPLKDGYFICPGCNKEVKKTSNSQKMCEKCAEEKRREKDIARKKKIPQIKSA